MSAQLKLPPNAQRAGPVPRPTPLFGRPILTLAALLPLPRALLCLFTLFLATGCVSSAEQQADEAVSSYMASDYVNAQQLLRPLALKTDENFVLNNDRLGSAAIADYDLDEAEGAFLRAYEVINSVGVNDGGRSLGAIVVSQNLSVWKGEPFERAMTNFYLGLVYYIRHDYGNARAAFENALFKLRDYGAGDDKSDKYAEYESNFVLADIMLGRCWQHLGNQDKAHDAFARAARLQPDLTDLANEQMNADSNVLLVVDLGYAPEKVKDDDGLVVGFSPTPEEAGPIPLPQVEVDGRWLQMGRDNLPTVDLVALAQDHRWQSIDTFRTIKAGVGYGLIGVGTYEALRSRSAGNAIAGLAIIGAGILVNSTAQADVRQWEMLPRTTFVLPMKLPPGTHDVTVMFPGEWGIAQTWHGLVVPAQGEATYYIRMQSSSPVDHTWPPPAVPRDGGQQASVQQASAR